MNVKDTNIFFNIKKIVKNYVFQSFYIKTMKLAKSPIAILLEQKLNRRQLIFDNTLLI